MLRAGLVIVAMLTLGGCEGAIDHRQGAGTRTTDPAATRSRFALPLPRPPDPPRRVPTRLAGGPLLLRVADPLPTREYGGAQTLHYALVFRLNRGALDFRSPSDPDNPDPVPGGAGTPVGDIVLDGARFLYDSAFGVLRDPRTGDDRDHCFSAELRREEEPVSGGDDRVQIAELDRLPAGAHVRVRIRPLDPKGQRSGRLGRSYTRRPAIREVRVATSPADPSMVRIADPAGRRALQRIGCTTADL